MKVTLTTKRSISMGLPQVQAKQIMLGAFYVAVFTEPDDYGGKTISEDIFFTAESSMVNPTTGKKAIVMLFAGLQKTLGFSMLGGQVEFFGPINVKIEVPAEVEEVEEA